MMKFRILILGCTWLLGIQTVFATQRVALVIGNADYRVIRDLPNASNDANDMAAALTDLGFQLYQNKALHNLTYRQMHDAIIEFTELARGKEMAFVYYAGHGMQIGARKLLPVDVEKNNNPKKIAHQSLDLQQDFIDELVNLTKVTIAVFDACREIPEYQNTRGGAAYRGLGRISAKNGQLIAYSGAAGQLVSDGNGRNSPYTAMLLKNLSPAVLRAKQWDVSEVFEETAWLFGEAHNGQTPEVVLQGIRPNTWYCRVSAPTPGI